VLQTLREQVFEANLELVRRGLVLYTFGNASGCDRDSGLVVIKPSGVPYEEMTPNHLVITDLEGRPVEGDMRPSSDLPTHLVLYRAFFEIGGVVHTHSRAATSWAQARRPIPCFGTTHADYFHGPIPVTEDMSAETIRFEYEVNTGHAIVRRFTGVDPLHMPAVLVAGHAPFTWGRTPADAAYNAVVLEEVAVLALQTVQIRAAAEPVSNELLDKHFFRKHGSGAYYGQAK
jgi:L-ribulose-5-phosphate 4-epimerase